MGFRRTKEELDAARLAVDAIVTRPPVPEMRRAWQEFIDRLEKAWNKFKLECDQVNNRAALDAASDLRKTDPLLQYLKQARHADQHTLQPSTMYGVGVEICLPPGAEVHLDFLKGTASAKGGDVMLRTAKPVYCLLPVTNRGVTFQPPTEHLGRPLTDATPAAVARLALEFYEALVAGSQTGAA
jgi:hypothetical protein